MASSEFSGGCSGEHSAAISEALRRQSLNSRAREIASRAARLDAVQRVDGAHEEPIPDRHDAATRNSSILFGPLTPAARKLKRSVESAQTHSAHDGIRPAQVRKAREATQELGDQLKPSPQRSHEAAKLRQEILANLEKLESLLEKPGARSPRSAGSVSETPTRPAAFDVVEQSPQGVRVAARVRPRPRPATLQVASPSHGEVRISGVARFFPAHTVHARRSTAVVTADNCELRALSRAPRDSVTRCTHEARLAGARGSAAFACGPHRQQNCPV